MTPFGLTQCPPPEGWGPWRPAGAGRLIAFTTDGVGRVSVDRGVRGVDYIVEAQNGDELHRIVVGRDDTGEAALHRCMVAVGLASPWTSEVPTQPGNYLVRWAETKGRPIVWTLEAGVWYGPSGVVSRPPPHGSSFLNIADLKERP